MGHNPFGDIERAERAEERRERELQKTKLKEELKVRVEELEAVFKILRETFGWFDVNDPPSKIANDISENYSTMERQNARLIHFEAYAMRLEVAIRKVTIVGWDGGVPGSVGDAMAEVERGPSDGQPKPRYVCEDDCESPRCPAREQPNPPTCVRCGVITIPEKGDDVCAECQDDAPEPPSEEAIRAACEAGRKHAKQDSWEEMRRWVGAGGRLTHPRDLHSATWDVAIAHERQQRCTGAPMDENELIVRVTCAVRVADKGFETTGGSSRHWVRDQFLPCLEEEGLQVVTKDD